MRDTETNLDYFGARYYSSGMGHWMSPDWAAKPASVPYANFGDPQSLNLYAFVTGNPVSRQDADGHFMTLAQLNGWGNCATCGMSTGGFPRVSWNGIPEGRSESLMQLDLSHHKEAAQQHVTLPQNADANLLTHLLFNEATSSGITAANSAKEMSAIAYTAVNWSDYLSSHPKYKPSWIGASGTSIDDVVHAKGQYGGVGGARWSLVDNQNGMSKGDRAILSRAASVVGGVIAGSIADPYGGKTFGMRTLGSGSPGRNFTALPQIEGSRNTFYTVTLP